MPYRSDKYSGCTEAVGQFANINLHSKSRMNTRKSRWGSKAKIGSVQDQKSPNYWKETSISGACAMSNRGACKQRGENVTVKEKEETVRRRWNLSGNWKREEYWKNVDYKNFVFFICCILCIELLAHQGGNMQDYAFTMC